MTNKQDEKIIIEGMEYTQKELDEIYAELMNPTSTPADSPKVNIPLGKGLQFITDQNLYKEIIKYFTKTFPSHGDVLNKKFEWNDSKSVATGSNPYIAVAVDMFLKNQKSKHCIAAQRDLETDIEKFKGFYEDTGLALRSIENPNKDSAEFFYNQIKKTNSQVKFPIFADLRDLELDANLNFKLTPQSRYKTADCLNWKSGTKYSQFDDYGLPKVEDTNSKRQIWTTKDGLVRAYLNWILYFNADNDNLPNSSDDGRVVLVSAEGGAL